MFLVLGRRHGRGGLVFIPLGRRRSLVLPLVPQFMDRLQRFALVLLELVLVQRSRYVALAVGVVPPDRQPPQVEAHPGDDGHDQNEHDK